MTPEIKDDEAEAPDRPEGVRPNGTTPSRLRAWVVGLLLIPLLVFWVEYTECIASGPDMAGMSLPMAVVFGLLVLIPVNLLVKRLAPRAALNQADLLMIYSMNTVAVYICGIGMMQFLNAPLVGWSHFATKENKWANWFDLIRTWAVPDPGVVRDYYNGKSSFFTPAHLAGWAGAITVWTTFLFVLLLCMYCIATLIRRQWVESEKLIFPIVQIPLEITRDGGDSPLWRSGPFWLGLGIPVVLESLAAVHFTLIPTVPYFPIKPETALRLDTGLTAPPWSAVGYLVLSFYPLVVGLTFLLSLDVSFSCWFFYLMTKVENVAATALGLRDATATVTAARVPYTNEQSLGAFVGLALFSLWLARPHLKATLRKAFLNDRSVDDSDEPLSYRAAWLGLLLCATLLVGFGVALGLSLRVSLLFFTLFFLLALAMTRIRAEAGLPWGPGSNAGWPGAHTLIIGLGGTQALTTQELTAFSFLHWFDSDWRCLVQPAELEAMKMAASSQPRPLNPRHMTAAILAAVVVGTLAAWVSCLGLYYHYGADSALVNSWRRSLGHSPFDELQNFLNNPLPTDWARISGAAAGLVVVSVLSLLRTRFVWWPLHPIGYAVGNTDTMTWIWFPTLMGWLFKTLILRYGGIKLYRTALPFFLGLVLGDFAISGLWALFFLAFHMPGYRTFPI